MAWFHDIEDESTRNAKDQAVMRVYMSSLILAFREYSGLHKRGFLKHGTLTDRAHALGSGKKQEREEKGYRFVRKVLFFGSAPEIQQLVDFIHGEGPHEMIRLMGLRVPRHVIDRGIERIQNGETDGLGVLEYAPDKLDKLLKTV